VLYLHRKVSRTKQLVIDCVPLHPPVCMCKLSYYSCYLATPHLQFGYSLEYFQLLTMTALWAQCMKCSISVPNNLCAMRLTAPSLNLFTML
jgi:hypothetical protein